MSLLSPVLAGSLWVLTLLSVREYQGCNSSAVMSVIRSWNSHLIDAFDLATVVCVQATLQTNC